MGENAGSEFSQLEEGVLADVRRLYSETAIDHAMNPRNVGELPDADGYGAALGHCGDSIEIWLKVRTDRVTHARFWTDGCASTIASGSVVTEMAIGKAMTAVREITQQDVLTALDGLPREQEHCAALAANAVREAVNDYLVVKREPWKRGYRTQRG